MRIEIVPCLKDNYAYLLVEHATATATIVDPSEEPPVIEAIERLGVRLVAIACTHHHWDHVGGIEALCARFPGIPVYGYSSDRGRIPQQTEFLEDGATVTIAGERATIVYIPGHTMGAIAYHFPEARAVFTGDTLFLAGCGRMFEGTPEIMSASLARLAALPADTRVYCGHEYTAANLRFARHLEPDLEAIATRQSAVDALRAAGRPTVPGLLSDELATNPFLRAHSATLRASLGLSGEVSEAEVFGAARRAKDGFAG